MFSRLKNDPLYQDLNWRLVLIGCVANLGAMGFGFDNGWWGGALGLSQFQRNYGAYNDELGRYAIPAGKTSVGTGTGSAGIILGCIMAPLVTSRLGRKRSFLVISALMGAGVVLESSAVTSFWQLVVGRILVYAGMGLSSNVTPMYLSECAPPRIRGDPTRTWLVFSYADSAPRCFSCALQFLPLSGSFPVCRCGVPFTESD